MISPRPVQFAKLLSSAAMAGALASCATSNPAPPPGSPPAMETNTVGLPACNPSSLPHAKYVVRIYLSLETDDVFFYGPPTPITREVYYDPLPETSSEISGDFQPTGTANTSRGYPEVNANPYHSDLTSIPGIQPADIVEFRVVLNTDVNSAGNSHNKSFFSNIDRHHDGYATRGTAVSVTNASRFICSGLSAGETAGAETRDVAYFYLPYRYVLNNPRYDSFSIFLVPRNGATTTVIIIDPKIMNNG
jgi:hypothetical protein